MKQLLAVACLAVLALIVMDSGQVVTGPTGLTINDTPCVNLKRQIGWKCVRRGLLPRRAGRGRRARR